MTDLGRATIGCLLVGDFVDEVECPANLAFYRGDVARPHVAVKFLDHLGHDDGMKELTVLMKEGRVFAGTG